MAQNLISLNLNAQDYAEIDAALTVLETKLAGLIDLPTELRRSLTKMGDKSEAFGRQSITLLAQNPNLVPASLDVAEAQRDLVDLDALRIRTSRIRQLLGRAEDTEMALGSDIMSVALEGYALLKVLGKGSGLDALVQGIGTRFSKSPRQSKAVTST